MSTVTDQIGTLLRRSPLPDADLVLADLLAGWTIDTITQRAALEAVVIAPDLVERVVVKAVARYMSSGPMGVASETVRVDDGQMTRQYSTTITPGDVEILDEWWTELGLSSPAAEAESFSIRPHYHRPYRHRSPWGRDFDDR